jgi:hypothetical protein
MFECGALLLNSSKRLMLETIRSREMPT